MNAALIRLYQRLPGPARSTAATLRGAYLRWWRYGAGSERLISEALDRDHWPTERLRAFQQERLSFVLERAAARVPFYREQWAARRQKGDRSSPARLENWPVLEKEQVRRNPGAFVADDCNTRWMFHEHTSGTTGKPLSVWRTRRTVQAWYALCEARLRVWYGLSHRDRWAMAGGQLVVAVEQRRPPFWVWNSALNQLYLSSYHLAPELIPHYLNALRQYRVRYILGYTSSLYELARVATEPTRGDVHLSIAITNAEPLSEDQRHVISQAFHCPVRETYGMAEAVAAASECEAGTLHLWPEAGWVEVLEDGNPVPAGASGDLVCTGLLNSDMPLIRYRVGDRGSLPADPAACACGRTLPALAAVDGRADDLLYCADGRRIGRLDPVFKANLPIFEAQIVQESLAQVRVRYVPAPGYGDFAGKSISERLRDRMGNIEVLLEPVNRIPRDPSGKFRAVVCSIPKEQRPDRATSARV